MTSGTRYLIRRKWLAAIGNIATAQQHLLDCRAQYSASDQKYTEIIDLNIAMLEQAKEFLTASRQKV